VTLHDLLQRYTRDSRTKAAVNALQTGARLQFKGLSGSAAALAAAAVCAQINRSHLFVFQDKEQAAYFQNDLAVLMPASDVLFYPSSYKRSVAKKDIRKLDGGNAILRAEVINHVNQNVNSVIVSYPEAVAEKVISKSNLKSNTFEIRQNEHLTIDFVTEVLVEYGFTRADFVYEPGQYAVRGSIVDIFSYSNDFPFRIDFFDNEVDSIRTFETVSQLSKARFDRVTILPDIQNNIANEDKISFFDFIHPETLIWTHDSPYILAKLQKSDDDSAAFISADEFKQAVSQKKHIELSNHNFTPSASVIQYNTAEQPEFNKKFKFLAEELNQRHADGFVNHILSANDKQFERLTSIFTSEELDLHAEFVPVDGILHKGFTDNDLRITCFTDHQIFGRYHKFKLKSVSYHESKEALTLRELSSLSPGDFVVHADHGIGQFGGLVTVELKNGKIQEAVRLVYKDSDVLLVNIHNLHKISKYKGSEGTAPKVYKLGSPAWANLKKKTKSRVKDIAKELIALYAKRKEERGFAFSPDTYLQAALESSFMYEDTPDQSKATEAVKADMENPMPMDRLVCGDVGFGKTEIAIRAAFKAVIDGKQVAVLVPTTVLAFQHYRTFTQRLQDMPVKIDYLSRMKTGKALNEALEYLANGKTDIIIGTHRLISKDVVFKDLGLLVVDEEQKFGVAVKDRLKALKVNVDTLTLTATPIPRTLQFSLMGARDLSTINTPPPNRYPIITELHSFDEEVIKAAIEYEIERNGQVFFIHNRIDTIYEVQNLLQRLVPDVSSVVAHGRMSGADLEQILLDFMDEKFGILIATTIVESGLDIANANTIIINNAQNFGLSDLHQLRGRVGRSDKKAFCYLLAPPLTAVSNEARQRLNAIESFSELGSGFNIAMQDLDIRGAGDLLGGEQSGFISDIGYETYHRILDEALLELRDTEFQDLFKNATEEEYKQATANKKFVTDCYLDTDLELLLPEAYIENITERLSLYRELDKITDIGELPAFESKLRDRFGEIPLASKELLNAVRLRHAAMDLGIEKITLKEKTMICTFVSDKDSSYYKSAKFDRVLSFVQKFGKKFEFKEKNDKLTLKAEQISTIAEAQAVLTRINSDV